MIDAINIYDINLERIGILSTWVSMEWVEGYNTMGSFLLEVRLTDTTSELIKTNRYCGIADSDTLMWIESVEINSEDSEIIAEGFPATRILTHRVSTAEISNVVAETAMRGLISDMEPWECVGLGNEAGITTKYTPQTSDQTIEEYCENIGAECDIGFKFVHDKKNKKLLFTCYQPAENPNAKYATVYGNISGIDYTASDIDYKNVAVVAGSGEGDERITVYAGDTDSTGYERREMYVDARNEQPEEEETDDEYKARLVSVGEGKLVEQAKVESIAFSVSDDVALGDIVLAKLAEIGITVKARVTEVTITSEENGETREITIGTPVVLKRT